MINKLRLINFKSHKDTQLILGNLTVLCGKNGVGKSSLIQSLLLLRQSHKKNRLDKVLDLNSPLCFIGKSKDAIYRLPNEEFKNEIGFVLNENGEEYSWIFSAEEDSTYLKRLNDLVDSDGFQNLSLFNNNFQYLSASRNTEYKSDNYAVDVEKQISINEGKGELVAQFLYEYGKKNKVINGVKHEREKDDFLLSQVTAWEREISDSVNVNPIVIGESFDIKYSFDTGNALGPIDEISKQNVGFGLSYALPIIVAILSSKEGSFLLIENPEAHIHPHGQAKIAELICIAAQAGIQLIVETHSDHIINGILVQCKKFEETQGVKGIDKNNAKIYYFDRTEKEHATISTEVEIDAGGKLKNQPKGFFDQIELDLNNLMGF